MKLDVNSLVYHKQTLRDIVADVSLKDGVYNVNALSGNPDAKFRLDGTGTLALTFTLSTSLHGSTILTFMLLD